MFGFLLVLLILDGLLLTVVVLLQAGKGGGLAAMGGASAGTDSLIGGRQAATLLTKASWTTGGLFLALALTLSVLSSRQRQPESVLRELQGQQAAPTAPAPLLPGSQAPAEGAAPAGTEGGASPAPATTGQ
ncbi:MAG TPA: preprotein translocase subunit SecG [Longimicrobiales bacterium]|nr:preprotein translocase subunit SecG [Longimicrobiales bacterium]